MKTFYKSALALTICYLSASYSYSQVAPPIQWQKSLGGTQDDYCFSVHQMANENYLVAGICQSSPLCSTNDYWIVELDTAGTTQTQMCYGGSATDWGYCVRQTSDGGFVVAGRSFSNDGNVSGNHGYYDAWIVKLSSSGAIQWQKSLGGTSEESVASVWETSDQGYILAGYAWSNDGDVSGNHGNNDCWVVKLDNGGNLQWQKCLGGTNYEEAFFAVQTNDGGYIVAGSTLSNDGDVSGNHGGGDYWIVKLDSAGNIQNQKCLGGTNDDNAGCIKQTADGGYVVIGSTSSFNGNVTGNHGHFDFWMVKLDTALSIQWQKSFGGQGWEYAYYIYETTDGGYFACGTATEDGGNVSGIHPNGGGLDYWVIKTDINGTLQWQKCLGGNCTKEDAFSCQQTADGGYIIAGRSGCDDGDVTGNNGSYDYWIVKLAPDPFISVPDYQLLPFHLQLFPNPATGNIRLTVNTKHNAPLHCEIINVMGEKVLTSPLTPLQRRGETTAQLDVSFLAKGIYVVSVGDGRSFENRKLVIE